MVASLLLYAPFYLHYHSPTHGLGTVTGRTNVGQFAQVFGFFGIAVLALVATLGWRQGLLRTAILAVRSPSPEAGALSQPHEGGETLVLALVLVAAVALAAVLHAWVLLLSLGTALLALYLLGERAPRLRRADVYALLLVTLSGIIVAGTEVVYLRDSFDGSAMYRMNTVFKFYYQVWILLGLVAAYAAWRVFDVLRHRSRALVGIWLVALVAGIGIGGTYTVLGPISFYGAQGGGPVDFQQSGLDGMTWMQQGDPLDYAAITWLQRHVHGNPTVLEATGGEYSDFARVSTFAGLPTLLGWQGHEAQWRGNVPELQIRHTVIDQIYSTGDARVAARLIHEYHVSLVYVGTCEQGVYVHGPASTTDVCGSSGTPTVPSAANALSKFGTFMHVIYNRDGVSIYHV